ncbi:metal ABC transporter solute-binding protein, Zn/Mn family [Cohnella herbarum]|uniref:Zinc ABC transporter solute-binding protein n=1 Tax=Cohnella herbarum TaxID=2728023 RepID=A0A7Z2ZJV6_9BACL|nr:zinc ABC transporter substrate-binding protein [Cohnella herbarum]QJD82268.1 zinc ABC transporter solute-binding protein [Cohnella herbarum]
MRILGTVNGRPRLLHKSKLVIIAILLLVGASLSACGKNNEAGLAEGKVNVVTSFYPLYYFAQEIGGDKAHVVNLIAAGVEPHEWTPKSRDLTSVSKAQLFLYNGAGLEGWVDDFLHGLGSDSKVITVEASKGISLIQGNPEHEEGHEDEHDAEEEHGHSDLGVDPHTWVSPRSALVMAANIRDAFVQADPANEAEYELRYADLEQRIKQLDDKYTRELSGYKRRDIVVSHQAFGYLARDYDLNQIAIMGLSPEAEPRSQDLLAIARYVKEHEIPYIFFEELVSEQLANTLASEAKVDTLVLNPLEGLTPEQQKAGENYFTLSERNLQNLQKALQ